MTHPKLKPRLQLGPPYLAMVKRILREHLPQAEVWAYGSRVSGDAYEASDLDLVARRPGELERPLETITDARIAFSDSDLPILVSLLDWARLPETFRREIEAAYVVVKEAKA